MRVLITGITGFIGSHLANELLKKKSYELVGTFRDKEKAVMYEKHGIEMRKADLLKPESLKDVTKDVDVVVHLAGLMRFHDPWDLLYNHNVKATQIIAADALQHGVQHFIYSSSTEAIGPVASIPGDETSPYNPSYDYGRTKQIAEQFLKEKQQTAGLPLTILRPTGVYGPGDVYVTLSTVRAVAHRKLRFLPGKGDFYIHFTYVDDIVEGIVRVLERAPSPNPDWSGDQPDPATSRAPYRIYNIGNNQPVELMRVIELLEIALGRKAHKNLLPMQAGDVPETYADVDDLARDTGFKPSTSIEEGLRRFVEWYKAYTAAEGGNA